MAGACCRDEAGALASTSRLVHLSSEVLVTWFRNLQRVLLAWWWCSYLDEFPDEFLPLQVYAVYMMIANVEQLLPHVSRCRKVGMLMHLGHWLR
jgi:hypothetical protein